MNEEEDSIFHELADHRNFLLTMSPGGGHDISEMLGFANASSDVKDMETLDVVSKWAILAAHGTLAPVHKIARWMSDFLSEQAELSEEEEEQTAMVYFSYSVALLSHLVDAGYIEISPTGDLMENLLDFINFMPGVISEVVVEEDDEYE